MNKQTEVANNVLLSGIALRLRMYRLKKGLSIKDAAGAVGINSERLFKWENDKEIPSTDKVALLAELYGVSEEEIWG